MTMYVSNRDGNGKTDEEGHYKFPLNAFSGNVLNANDLVVTQQSPVALGVAVAPGQFRVVAQSNTFAYSGWTDSAENITITTADTANPRITSIVLYIDKSAPTSPTPPNNPGVAKFIAVNGNPAATPLAPTNAVIQASVGASNPYIVLADVLVNANAVSIANGNITDRRTMVTLVSNLVNNAAIRDDAVSTSKIQNSAITSAKITNGAISTAKFNPSIITRACVAPTDTRYSNATTTYTVLPGSTFTYTSGSTPETVFFFVSIMPNKDTGGEGKVRLEVNGVLLTPEFYVNPGVPWARVHINTWYHWPANTTYTIRLMGMSAGGGTLSVCNESSQPQWAPFITGFSVYGGA